MTRWARVTTTRSKRPLPATSWEDLRKGSSEGTGQNLPRRKQPGAGRPPVPDEAPQAKRKKNRKKKEYLNEDVNGFMDYLREHAHGGPQGEVLAADSEDVREEVARALKKDSRREGRRLKRQAAKKNAMVCFHCRQPGHGIADCPAALENQEMGTGICYRCGSTEHEITKCKAKVDPALGEFPFAKCFVCGEMGHLSRSCPDNPKGLYADELTERERQKCLHPLVHSPNGRSSQSWADQEPGASSDMGAGAQAIGPSFTAFPGCSRGLDQDSFLSPYVIHNPGITGGGCKLCGSVEHLKKDCPEAQNSERLVTVGRWAKGMSADYEDILDVPKPQKPKAKVPKVVHF